MPGLFFMHENSDLEIFAVYLARYSIPRLIALLPLYHGQIHKIRASILASQQKSRTCARVVIRVLGSDNLVMLSQFFYKIYQKGIDY